jgi:crotonobetainyl-CoA:carnitine CoA-transferase CaiB-like acyl-CoA transferase
VLDETIATWTVQRSAHDTASILQAHGIAATATLEPAEVVNDVQLQARSFVNQVPRLDGSGRFTSHGAPWVIDGQRPRTERRAPSLGEDNAAVFKSLLGVEEHDYEALIRDQIIY